MKYMLLIHQGDSPTPRSSEAWGTLSEYEQRAIFADYQAVSQTPGIPPGLGLDAPETATTVRVQDGKTLTTDGPFVEIKESIGGYLLFEADDLEAACRLPPPPSGGGRLGQCSGSQGSPKVRPNSCACARSHWAVGGTDRLFRPLVPSPWQATK